MKQTDLEKLLADMSLKEKVDQMLQLSGAFYLGDENSVLTGPANDMGIGKEDLEMAGSILGAAGADTMKKLQDDYMAKQPHHIPMLFMMDVIHGMKTIFPAPLAQGATLIRNSPASARLQPQKKHPRPDFTLPFLRWLTLCAMRDGAASWNPQAKIRT